MKYRPLLFFSQSVRRIREIRASRAKMEWLFGSSGSSGDAAAAAPLSASTARGRSAPSEEDDSQHRVRGNELFQRREFEAAAQEYALGIARRPTATLLSNRSAALCALGRFQEALEDAERAAELDPRWAKTYSRKGKALYGLRGFRKAADAYARGLELCLQGAQGEANQRDAELECGPPYCVCRCMCWR
jgi:small glutamine-rich tetratricopeptide repeat-containing protein alpha